MDFVAIDNQTLFFLSIIIMLSLSFIMGASMIIYKQSIILTHLFLGNVFYTLFYITTYLGGVLGNFKLAVLVGICEVIAMTFWSYSVKKIIGVQNKERFMIAINIINLVSVITFTYILPNTSLRRFVTTFAFALLIYEVSFRILRNYRKHKLQSYKLISYSFLAYAVYKTFMGFYRLFVKLNIKSVFDVDFSISMFNITAIIFAILINLSIAIFEQDTLVEEIRKISVTDHLTKLYNRRYFMNRLDNELELCRRSKSEVYLVIIDIDDFKKVNDNYGHNIGDDVLVEFSSFLSSQIRKSDLIARYGGEEFVVLIHEDSKVGFQTVMDRIYKEIALCRFSVENLRITFSAGAVNIDSELAKGNVDKIISIADTHLYTAKIKGKDRLIVD